MIRPLGRIAALPPLRQLLRSRPLAHVGFVVALASLVRESRRFVVAELRHPGSLGRYHLRDSGLPVYIRHASLDIPTLAEIFYEDTYAFPEPVARWLASRPRPLVVDLGANVGLFGTFVRRSLPAAEIVAVEVDPANADVHRRLIDDAGDSSWRLNVAAASNEDGELRFHLGRGTMSRTATDEDPSDSTTVPAIDVLPDLARADLVKMDIEGGEWPILTDSRFVEAGPQALVLEYHAIACPWPDAREAIGSLLRDAGYEVSLGKHADHGFGPHGLAWAWRPGLGSG